MYSVKSQDVRKGVDRSTTLDIVEATFRYQFRHNHSGQQENAKAYYLTFLNQDPSLAVLARFKNHSPPVLEGSRFAVRKGIQFKIDVIRCPHPPKVQVWGGYYEGDLSSSIEVYTVEHRQGQWMVTGADLQSISRRRLTRTDCIAHQRSHQLNQLPLQSSPS